MVFSKPIFLFGFLPIVLILYYACPKRLKNTVLLMMSLIFYAWGEPKFVFLMAATILIDYTAGRLIVKYSGVGGKKNCSKIILLLAIIINLGFLCYFKYTNFIIENLNAIAGGQIAPLDIILPIGISFYTFQTMSYLIDVYRKEVPAEKNILNFATYVTLFPQLIAGPIVQYKTIADELVLSSGDDGTLCGRSMALFCRSREKGSSRKPDRCAMDGNFPGILAALLRERRGSARWHTRFRFILIFPDTLIWRSGLAKCLDSILRKILIIPIFPKALRNSGGAGIFPLEHGFGNMYISRLGEIGKA